MFSCLPIKCIFYICLYIKAVAPYGATVGWAHHFAQLNEIVMRLWDQLAITSLDSITSSRCKTLLTPFSEKAQAAQAARASLNKSPTFVQTFSLLNQPSSAY